MSKPIIVKEAINSSNCISLDQGNIIFPIIKAAVEINEEIILDFSGIEFIATPFFNASLGQLMRANSKDDVLRLVKLKNTPYDLKGMIIKVLDNALSFYKNANSEAHVSEVIKKSIG